MTAYTSPTTETKYFPAAYGMPSCRIDGIDGERDVVPLFVRRPLGEGGLVVLAKWFGGRRRPSSCVPSATGCVGYLLTGAWSSSNLRTISLGRDISHRTYSSYGNHYVAGLNPVHAIKTTCMFI